MQDEIITENADSVENTASTEEVETVVEESTDNSTQESVEETPVAESTSKNMSEEDFINLRLGGQKLPNDAVEEESKSKDNAESEGEEETKTDVLSQVDLDEMTEEELSELSQKLGSRAVKRFGELTARRKQAEERIQTLESQLKKKSQVSMQDIDQNPYKGLKNMKEIQSKSKEIKDVIEWAEDVLFESDNYSAQDKVAEMDGKNVTKVEVRNILKNARKAQKKHIPQQVQHLRNQAQGLEMRKGFQEKLRQEISWSDKKDNPLNQRYTAMLKDARLQSALKNADPVLKAQMPYLLAHATNSIFGERKIINPTEQVKPSSTIDPPKSVSNTAVKSEKPTSRRSKNIKTNQTSFRSTGGIDDFIKLRTAQLSR